VKSANVESREQVINIHSRVKAQRAQNVFSEPIDMSEDFVAPQSPKSESAIAFIDITTHFIAVRSS
jgi:hypothetical protein